MFNANRSTGRVPKGVNLSTLVSRRQETRGHRRFPIASMIYRFLFSLSIFLVGTARGGATSEQNAELRLEINPGPGQPDTNVVLPLYLWTDGGSTVALLTVDITFPSNSLSFVSAEKAFGTELAGIGLKSEVKQDSRDDTKSVLSMAMSGEEQHRIIPEGPIAYITFQILKDVALNQDIVLKGEANGASADDPPKQIDSIPVSDGKIWVQAPAVTACFFYMH